MDLVEVIRSLHERADWLCVAIRRATVAGDFEVALRESERLQSTIRALSRLAAQLPA